MNYINRRGGFLVIALALALPGGTTQAQTSPGTGPAAGTIAQSPANPASAAGAQTRRHRGGRSAAWWGSDVTPGWALMTWAERNEHRKHMQTVKSYEECQSYMDQHHAQMAARAREKGKEPLMQPRRDACARLKP